MSQYVYSLLPLPHLPTIISEWAGVIPLVCHLAGYRHDYELVGQVSLTKRISIGLFPKLGCLHGVAQLLKGGPEFLDAVSSKGRSISRVWDVRWGSGFPCANGAAGTMLVRYSLGKINNIEIMPDRLPEKKQPTNGSKESATGSVVEEKISPAQSQSLSSTRIQDHRRYQTLHVLQFRQTKPKRSWMVKIDDILTSPICEGITFMTLIGINIILCYLGLYGTAVILACGALSHVACQFVIVNRPLGYLDGNETDKTTFMLNAIHENANAWYLYTGDRACIDTLLNKTMVFLPPLRRRYLIAYILKAAHGIQLIAMTFVAGQKGWDGISLLILMLLDSLWRWRYSEGHVARRWIDREGVDIHTKSYNFTGRTIMIGAIQSYSGTETTAWMDDILVPHPRREAWLARLRRLKSCRPVEIAGDDEQGTWSDHDWKAIRLSSELGFQAAEILRKAFSTQNA